jgi:hypothetical protein
MSEASNHGKNGSPPGHRPALGLPEGIEVPGDDAEAGEEHGIETYKELPEVELGPTPDRIKELIAACVRFVGARYGVVLDGTPDTLSLLDHYIAEARAEVATNPASADLVQGALGAYFGEVLRQAFLGEWYAEGPAEEWRIDMRTVFLSFNPIGMAREALLLDHAEGWHAHLEMEAEDRAEIEARLASLGDVDEEEYYAPTTRFEVVELATLALRARMVERGLGDVRFGPDDYRSK